MFRTDVIKDLFLRGITSCGIEKEDGTYSGALYFIDDGMLDLHIEGKRKGKPFSIGVPVGDKTSWGFVHLYLDRNTLENIFDLLEQYRHIFKEQIRLIRQNLFDSYEARLYPEYDGAAGYRLWCFFEEGVNRDQLFQLLNQCILEVEWLCEDI